MTIVDQTHIAWPKLCSPSILSTYIQRGSPCTQRGKVASYSQSFDNKEKHSCCRSVQLSAAAGIATITAAITTLAMAQLTLKYHPIAYLPFSLATPVAIKVAGKVDSIFSVHWFIGQTSWVKGSGFPQAPRSAERKKRRRPGWVRPDRVCHSGRLTNDGSRRISPIPLRSGKYRFYPSYSARSVCAAGTSLHAPSRSIARSERLCPPVGGQRPVITFSAKRPPAASRCTCY